MAVGQVEPLMVGQDAGRAHREGAQETSVDFGERGAESLFYLAVIICWLEITGFWQTY